MVGDWVGGGGETRGSRDNFPDFSSCRVTVLREPDRLALDRKDR